MDIRTMLESHKRLKLRIEETLSEIEQFRRLTEKVANNSEAGSRLCVVNRAVEIDKKLIAQYDEYAGLHDRISEMIDSLDNDAEIIALKRFYILHERIDTVAANMSYSSRHVTRLISQGIEDLQKKYGGRLNA